MDRLLLCHSKVYHHYTPAQLTTRNVLIPAIFFLFFTIISIYFFLFDTLRFPTLPAHSASLLYRRMSTFLLAPLVSSSIIIIIITSLPPYPLL